MICGIAVGITSTAAISDAADSSLFVKIFGGDFWICFRLFGLIVGLLMTGKAQEFSQKKKINKKHLITTKKKKKGKYPYYFFYFE